jgi:hypothetical protein
MDHGFLCSVERLGGLVLFGFDGAKARTWVYRPQEEAWSLLEPKGELPERPMDHGQAASDGRHLYLLGGFGGEDVPQDAGLVPRGAMWRF